MQDKTKNLIITIGFVSILIFVFIANIIVKDKKISETERRKLAQFPEISLEKIIKGNAIDEWEKYSVDQFIARDLLRSVKAYYSLNIYRQKDNNDLFIKNEGIYKMEYPLNIKNIEQSANKIKNIYDKYLQGMNVYYAIIPEKNYYLKNDDHLKINYSQIKEIMQEKLTKIKYIDIWDSLELDDYYKTDLHWRQEKLQRVVSTIQYNMQLQNTANIEYSVIDVGQFYGTYYGQLGIDVPPDRLYILTNDTISKCTTYNMETQKTGKVYEQNKTSDKYDIYLSGATPLISIENPNSLSEKELLLFRDSFGSSLAPLLIENYKKITLIDTRYISSKILNEFIDFKNQDVLFIYSTQILNQNVFR